MKHNHYYKNITINTSNLQWMGTKDECVMTSEVLKEEIVMDEKESTFKTLPATVSETQTETNAETECFEGIHQDGMKNVISNEDAELLGTLKKEVAKKKPLCTINFPTVEQEVLSEYNHDILPNVFPWNYPGGYGGNNSLTSNLSLNPYSKMMLCYGDGRFASDDVWCYYMLDMI